MKRVVAFFAVAVLFTAIGYVLGHTATIDSAESAIRNHQNWRLKMYLLQAGSASASTASGSLLNIALGEKGNDDAALMLIDGGAMLKYGGSGLSPLEAAMVYCRPAVVSALLQRNRSWDEVVMKRAISVDYCPEGREQITAIMASNKSLERAREK